MNDIAEKYVAKALEGYEQNYEGITEAIEKMETQLESYKEHQAEMAVGIKEMKDLLGLDEEEAVGGKDTPLTLVNDGTAIE
jgi:hypothetical protein